MKTVIRLLKKELREWKENLASDKDFFKGEETDKNAIRNFKEDNLHIEELKKAIDVLKNNR